MNFPGRFEGKVLVVTGSAQGLGEAVATRAAREGGAVALVDRSMIVNEVAEKLASEGAQTIALVSDRGGVEFAAGLPPRTFPVALGIAPDGEAIWYFDGSTGRAVVLRVGGGGRFFPAASARWVSWSPSGRFLAAATDAGILLLEWPSGRELAQLPVEARDVTWTLKP